MDALASTLLPYVHMPLLCLFGVLTNALNILVFVNHQMKDVSFKYMMAISISDLFYLAILSISFISYCDDCSINRKYSLQMYVFYLDQYLTRCMAIFNILAEISLSIQRYMVLINKPFIKKRTHKWLLLILFLFSLVYYFPMLFFKHIVYNEYQNNMTKSGYSLKYNKLGS